MNIRIITDSASDIIQGQHSLLSVLPMTITFGEEQFLDGVNLSREEFYLKLVETDAMPSTSQISPYSFEQLYKRVREAGEQALVITMSGRLSGTYQSAVAAAEEYKDIVRVVDSLNVTVGEHVLVDYALKLRSQGLGLEQLAQELERRKTDICMLALVDTLTYLQKGGRLSKAAAFAGSLLSIKPVVSLEEGEVAILGKARGSKHGHNLLDELIEKKGGIDFDMPIMLGYTGMSDALLEKYIEDNARLWKGHLEKLPKVVVGGTIGTHAGPGAIAIAFYHK